MSSPQDPQPSAASPGKPVRQPALLYVLAAFGIIAGGYGSINSITSAALMLKPPEEFARIVEESNRFWQPQQANKDEINRLSAHQAEAAYGRRKAALPLHIVGVIVSCLLFAGCLRSMTGDRNGPALWSLAASVCIPYQLLAMALALLTLRDLAHMQDIVPDALRLVRLGIVFSSALAIGYYGSCVVYLRARDRQLSGGAGRTPPSA